MSGDHLSEVLRRVACAATVTALVCSSSGFAFAEQAGYARLTQVQGPVMVVTGSGFVQVAGDVELKLGDRVLIIEGGGAYLDFGANGAFPLEAPSMPVHDVLSSARLVALNLTKL